MRGLERGLDELTPIKGEHQPSGGKDGPTPIKDEPVVKEPPIKKKPLVEEALEVAQLLGGGGVKRSRSRGTPHRDRSREPRKERYREGSSESLRRRERERTRSGDIHRRDGRRDYGRSYGHHAGREADEKVSGGVYGPVRGRTPLESDQARLERKAKEAREKAQEASEALQNLRDKEEAASEALQNLQREEADEKKWQEEETNNRFGFNEHALTAEEKKDALATATLKEQERSYNRALQKKEDTITQLREDLRTLETQAENLRGKVQDLDSMAEELRVQLGQSELALLRRTDDLGQARQAVKRKTDEKLVRDLAIIDYDTKIFNLEEKLKISQNRLTRTSASLGDAERVNNNLTQNLADLVRERETAASTAPGTHPLAELMAITPAVGPASGDDGSETGTTGTNKPKGAKGPKATKPAKVAVKPKAAPKGKKVVEEETNLGEQAKGEGSSSGLGPGVLTRRGASLGTTNAESGSSNDMEESADAREPGGLASKPVEQDETQKIAVHPQEIAGPPQVPVKTTEDESPYVDWEEDKP